MFGLYGKINASFSGISEFATRVHARKCLAHVVSRSTLVVSWKVERSLSLLPLNPTRLLSLKSGIENWIFRSEMGAQNMGGYRWPGKIN